MFRSLRSIALLSTLTLAACGAGPSGAPARDSLTGEGGVKVSLTLGDAKNQTTKRTATGFMNITATTQYATQPMRFTAELGNSEAAKKIKAKGEALYVYAGTQLRMDVVSNGKKRVKKGGVNLEGKTCEGYTFVLYPGNNYRVSVYAEPKIRIRDKTRADTILGKYSEDWYGTSIEGYAHVAAIRTRPFMVVEYGARYINPKNFGPAVVVSREFDKDCTLNAYKPYFKSAGNQKNKYGNVVRRAPKAP
ncbi:hypothetical protein E7681_00185 [Thalassobius vesicularis]|uniref:Lipoprotein n=1 Tax=Thalassobius vesicularis TaxID=1294297 RepID=A0A4S3MDG0_9RHOB|nr:hypothetical protein [Thalassobius vesicularis]THD76296.1 hypothetical protein E7681_00185 [Thalassobius vesicularis]